MKKTLSVFLVLLSLTACGKKDDPKPQPTPDPTPSSVPTPTPTVTPTPDPTPIPDPTPTPSPSPDPSPTPDPEPLFKGPKELGKYVNKFVADGMIQKLNVIPNMKNPMLEIQLASLKQYGQYVIGLCESGGNQRRVTFDPSFWNSVDETQKELLAHHELGHCVLGRPHRTDLLKDKTYASIMYPVIMKNTTYMGNFDYYQNELYTWQGSEAPGSSQVYICNEPQK